VKRSGESGVAAIEFAVLLPVLVLIVLGIIEFGILLYNQQVITNASREGARHGIKNENGVYYQSSSIEDVVKNYIYPQYPSTNPSRLITLSNSPVPATLTVTTGTSCSSFGNDLEIDVRFQSSFLVMDNFGFNNPDLTAKTIMRCE